MDGEVTNQVTEMQLMAPTEVDEIKSAQVNLSNSSTVEPVSNEESQVDLIEQLEVVSTQNQVKINMKYEQKLMKKW